WMGSKYLWSGSPKSFALSCSPDGEYMCLVTEKEPPGLMLSPYLYTFSILKRSEKEPLPGSSYLWNTDEVPLKELRFEWAADHLTILELGYPGPRPVFSPILRAYFDDGTQRWTRATDVELHQP